MKHIFYTLVLTVEIHPHLNLKLDMKNPLQRIEELLEKLIALHMAKQERWLSVRTASHMLQRCPRTLKRYAQQGLLEAKKIGANCFYLEASIMNFLKTPID